MSTIKEMTEFPMSEIRADMNDKLNRVYFLSEDIVIKRYKRKLAVMVNYEKYIKMVERLEELDNK